ncbi:hypothetical protein COJ60_29415 [Bacillus cereus]|uniref:DUF418 domain-containing protein n=1 Tax=Bacillus paranthracis TaxID=2026186 RepID=UPI000BF6AB96|nr:DUF418 domain-containing protein [Bacillus paranthracis]NMW17026.1 DUF418 domain-containing protein [Bacillus paranthracis]PFN29488.1 hypothetical protein COJ60_29415 [Bacillus cereus]RAT14541.1 hypothetical protein A6E22_00100 [Bacillus cereus]
MHTKNNISTRIISLDILRGFALIGMLIIHAAGLSKKQEIPMYAMDFYLDIFNNMFIHFKFVSIFSFLFGVGSYFFFLRAQQRGLHSYHLFSRRLITLLPIGIISILICPQITPILIIYSLFGFSLLLFFRLVSRMILRIAGLIITCNILLVMGAMVLGGLSSKSFNISVQIICYAVTYLSVIFSMMLLGLYVGKINFFQQLSQQTVMIKKIQKMSCCLSLSLILGGLWTIYINPDVEHNISFQGLCYITAHPLSIFYLSSIILLYNKNHSLYIYKPLSYVGRISLTAYIGHALLLKLLPLLLGWTSGYTLVQSLILSCIIFTMLIIFSFIWLQKFKQGPIEKIWHLLTFGNKARA